MAVSKFIQRAIEESPLHDLTARIFGNRLTGAEREANLFSSAEAQKQREWDLKMYEQYESPDALVRQYREAGLNPALMFGNSGSVGGDVASSGSVPSSVSPHSAGNPIDHLLSLAQMSLNARNLVADIDLKRSQAEKNRADARATTQKLPEEIESLRSGIKLNEAQINKYTADVEKVKADTALATQHLEESKAREALAKADISVAEARAALIKVQTFTQRIDAQYRAKYWDALIDNFQAQSSLADAHSETESKLRESRVKDAKARADKAEELLTSEIQNILSQTKLSEKQRKYMFTQIMSAVGTMAVGGAALGSIGVKLFGTAAKAVAPPIIPSLHDDTSPVESILN